MRMRRNLAGVRHGTTTEGARPCRALEATVWTKFRQGAWGAVDASLHLLASARGRRRPLPHEILGREWRWMVPQPTLGGEGPSSSSRAARPPCGYFGG